jgi:hypothetical protein
LDAALPELKHIKPGPEIDRFLSERVFIDAIPHQDAGLRAILRDWPADAIIGDTTFSGVVPLLLGPATERPASVNCGIACLLIERDDGASWGPGLTPATTDAHYQEYAAIRAERNTLVTEPGRVPRSSPAAHLVEMSQQIGRVLINSSRSGSLQFPLAVAAGEEADA